MHPNRAFAWEDRETALAFVAEIAFCTICVDGPFVAHAPVVVDAPDRLRFHLARGNRADGGRWRASARSSPASGRTLISAPIGTARPIRSAPGIISRVEAEGPLRRLDEAELVALLDDLSAIHEARLAPKPPWTRAKMSPGRFEAMLKAIIGFEMTIEDLRGTNKLGQHKSEERARGRGARRRAVQSRTGGADARGAAMTRLAIFDCDGTLVDSQHNICAAMAECFTAAGLEPPPPEQTRRVVGLSLVEAMRAMRPEAGDDAHVEMAESYKSAFQAMRARGLDEEPLYDGIADLLDALAADGWAWASPPASPIAGWPCASRIMASRTVSSPCRPPTATRPSRIRR